MIMHGGESWHTATMALMDMYYSLIARLGVSRITVRTCLRATPIEKFR